MSISSVNGGTEGLRSVRELFWWGSLASLQFCCPGNNDDPFQRMVSKFAAGCPYFDSSGNFPSTIIAASVA